MELFRIVLIIIFLCQLSVVNLSNSITNSKNDHLSPPQPPQNIDDHDHNNNNHNMLSRSMKLPPIVLGFYILLADDTVQGYTSYDDWQPSLYKYQINGANVLWFSFINPATMDVPISFINLSNCKGEDSCPLENELIIWSIGGIGYSQQEWPFLNSQYSAYNMALQVATWFVDYNIDGIDLDIEDVAASDTQSCNNLIYFVQQLRTILLNNYNIEDIIITQPVYGFPQEQCEIDMVNNAWNKNKTNLGLINSIGLMVYDNQESLYYVKDYSQGPKHYPGFPITVNVPTTSIMAGIQGTAAAIEIMNMTNNTINRHLGGFMVWCASVWDSTRNTHGLQYADNDASWNRNITGDVWIEMLQLFRSVPPPPDTTISRPPIQRDSDLEENEDETFLIGINDDNKQRNKNNVD